jgi:hypothetical protein
MMFRLGSQEFLLLQVHLSVLETPMILVVQDNLDILEVPEHH